MVDKSENQELLYDKLKNSKFKQQKLAGWRPIPSMVCNTVFLVSFGLVFIGIGVAIVIFSNDIVEIRQDYKFGEEEEDDFDRRIEKDMKKPIMVYYELDGFYQNHRRYMKSKSINQLKGISNDEEDEINCDPFVKNEDMEVYTSIDEDRNKLDPNEIAIPCGLMAKSFFNDNFEFEIDDVELPVDEENIALEFDKKNYKNINKSKQWHDMEDEHFIVWMRPAGLPKFRKLWGRINKDLKKGQVLNIYISGNNYNADAYNASKAVILSTVNHFGGKNMFLGISYIVIGGICLILSVVFLIGFKMHKKKEK